MYKCYATINYMYTCSIVFFRQAVAMTSNVRLKVSEQEALRRKAIEINKELVKRNMQPLTDSQLIHVVIEAGIKRIVLGERGEVIID